MYAQAGVSLDSFKWMFNTQPPRTRTAVLEKKEKIHLRWINKQFPCEWTLAGPETFMCIKSNTVDKTPQRHSSLHHDMHSVRGTFS